MNKKLAVTALALLALAGCTQKALFDKFIPKEEAEYSKNYLASLQARDFEKVEAKLDPQYKTADLRAKLMQMADFFPNEKPIAIETVGANTLTYPDFSQYNLTFQYQYPSAWILANVAFQRKSSGEIIVIGLNVRPLPDSLENINRFSLTGKSGKHLAFLAITIIVPLFIIITLYICYRTPIPRRKWMWFILVLFGIGRITLNWTDGAVHFLPLSFHLLGGGAFKPGIYGPWLLSVSAPIGAVVFLFIRKTWLKQPDSV